MTMKDFMNAVIAASISDEMTAFATAEIAKIDGKNAKRRNTMTDAQKDNYGMIEYIAAGMKKGDVITAAEVATAHIITSQKASALMQMGVKSGKFIAVDVKVKGKGKVKGYTLA